MDVCFLCVPKMHTRREMCGSFPYTDVCVCAIFARYKYAAYANTSSTVIFEDLELKKNFFLEMKKYV